MTQKRPITRAASILSFSPPGETMSAFFRPKTITTKLMLFVLKAFCASSPTKHKTKHDMIFNFWEKGGKETISSFCINHNKGAVAVVDDVLNGLWMPA